jgi:hypothetical protein
MKVAIMTQHNKKLIQSALQDAIPLTRAILVASHNLNLALIADECNFSEDFLSNTPRILTEIVLHSIEINGGKNA